MLWINKYNDNIDSEKISIKTLNDRNNVMIISKYNAAVEL
jgi:hypothetical protein